ncbi:MAG: hypothetical protein DRG63_05335 [Deltaproteobacteria bacterium]|nr:MAG: hypothetical protein DRG63_05335 [Deltaproteobacteria bacterium]
MWQSFLQSLLNGEYYTLLAASCALFLLGLWVGKWWAGMRAGGRKSRRGKGDEAFIKGIHYILSDDRDHAIEELTKYVQMDSETVETYVALGNLYRSKGDIERAIRIRQSIILRPNIDKEIRLRALFDLGLDYKKGGLLNRALHTFLEVSKKNPSDVQTLQEIERIYEELREWEKAYETRKKIARLQKGDHAHILAHHLVEMGKVSQKEGNLSKARIWFKKAINTHRECVDAYLHLGDLYAMKQEYKKAISAWKRIAIVAPRYTFLAYDRLEETYSKMKNRRLVEEFLRESAQVNGDAFTHLALSRFLFTDGDVEGALRELQNALERTPHLWEARKFQGEILLHSGRQEEALEAYEELIAHLDIPSLRFQCTTCGFEANELHWQCPKCRTWDSMAPLGEMI